MAPKIGPRGTTIQDVMNVAQNGAQPVESNYVYAPPSTQPPATTAFDYASLLAGQPAPTYGQKYGGMPTAEYFKALNIGAAQQARSVGDLARMQAATNFETLQRKLVGDLYSGTNKLTPSFRAQLEGPLMPESTSRNTAILNMTPAIADIETRLAAKQREARRLGSYEASRTGINNQITALEAELRDTQRGLRTINPSRLTPEELTAENKADAYSAYMDRMNMLQSSDLTKSISPEGVETLTYPSTPVIARNAAERQTQINLQPSYDASLAQQVTPYDTLAEGIGNIPLSQLAQQMAVQRYGYDPALAAGLFDQSVDIQALTDEQTLYGLMNPQLSYSPEERIYQQYGQEGLDLYNEQQAQSSLYGTPTEQTDLEQQQYAEVDTNLFGVYASTPAEVYKENPNAAREYMADPVFLSEYQAGVTEIAGAGQGLQETKAREFLTDYWNASSDPVRSKIMENLIDSAVSFMGA